MKYRRLTLSMLIALISAVAAMSSFAPSASAVGGVCGVGMNRPYELCPGAITNNATNITQTTATFNGEVNPGDNTTSTATCTFVYQVTGANANTAITVTVPGAFEGNTFQPVSYNITGLSIGTNYSYYLECTQGSQVKTSDGDTLTFMTTNTPAVTTTAATQVTAASATLNGTVNPEGSDKGTTSCQFYYGTSQTNLAHESTTSPYNAGNGTDQLAVTGSIGSLTANTTYYDVLSCTSPAGTVNGTPVQSFTTSQLSGGSVAPQVTNVAASSLTADSANLNGTVNPEGAATTCSYNYGPSATALNQSSGAPASVGNGTTAVAYDTPVTGLTSSTTYYYQIACTNSAGTSLGSPILSFKTDAAAQGTVAPTVVTGAASGVTSGSATLNGTVNPNGTATSCYFEYGTSTSYGSTTLTVAYGAGTTATAVTAGLGNTLVAATTYHYKLFCSNGIAANGADMTFTTGASTYTTPSVATGAATSVTTTTVTLNGLADPNGVATSCHFNIGPTEAYGLSTSPTSVGSGTAAVLVTASLTGLSPATLYHYQLFCTSASGSSPGADETFTTAANVTPCTSNCGPPTTYGIKPPPGTTTKSKPGFKGGKTDYASKKGYVTLVLSCTKATRCTGTVTLTTTTKSKLPKKAARAAKAKTYKVGSARYSIAAGKTAKIKIKLSKAYFTYLKTKLKLSVTAKAVDSDKATSTAKRTLKYKKPKIHKKK